MSTELDTELKAAPSTPVPAGDDFLVRPRSRGVARLFIWGAVLALIAGAVALVYSRRAGAAPAVHYETAEADRGTIAAKVTATGNLSALLTIQVGSQVSGRVQELFADFNSPVKKGETIAKLDPVLFQAAVEQALANLVSAQGNMKKDQAQEINTKQIFDRTKNLVAAQIMAQSDLDTASANYDAAKAQVEADQSNLEAIGARAPSGPGQSGLHDHRFAD